MLVFKCDRCGTITGEWDAYARVEILMPDNDMHFDLCEQCYQTIKEVLEDGEIK